MVNAFKRLGLNLLEWFAIIGAVPVNETLVRAYLRKVPTMISDVALRYELCNNIRIKAMDRLPYSALEVVLNGATADDVSFEGAASATIPVVSLLLASKANPNEKPHGGTDDATHLINVVTDCDDTGVCLKLLNLLVQNGADVEAADGTGWTPLMRACRRHRGGDVTRTLLGHNCDVSNRRSVNGCTALNIACEYAEHKSVVLLLTAKADPNVVNTQTQQTPLLMAIVNCDHGTVNALLCAGAEPTEKDLEKACFKQNYLITEMLLANGAEATTGCVVAALTTASEMSGFEESLESMKPHLSGRERTIRHTTVVDPKNGLNVVRLLKGAGAEPPTEHLTSKGIPSIDAAISGGDKRRVRLLLECGLRSANPETQLLRCPPEKQEEVLLLLARWGHGGLSTCMQSGAMVDIEIDSYLAMAKFAECHTCGDVPPRSKLMKCSGCRKVHYCSKQCQLLDWKQGGHKNKCAELSRS